jgi:O-glycosyl hydrolase
MKRKLSPRRVLSLVLAAALVASLIAFAPLAAAASGNITVDWDHTYQTHEGVGFSTAFNKGHALLQIQEFAPEVTEHLYTLLFDDEAGIGFDIVRPIIGDGGVSNGTTKAQTWGSRFYDGASDTIEPEEDDYVWDRDDWDEVKEYFDEGQISVLQKAQEYGVRTYYADAWTTPYWMKTNKTILGGKINPVTSADLPTGRNKVYYQKYADYLVQLVVGYKREFGIELTHVGPSNESDGANTSYSQMSMTAAELTDLYVNYCIPTFEKARDDGLFDDFAKLPTLAGPEGTNLSASFSTYGNTMNNPAIYNSEMFNTFTTHVYGSAPTAPLIAGTSTNYSAWIRNYPHIWQTEYMDRSNSSGSNDATQTYANEGITDAVKWANLVTNLFSSDPAFSAYLTWWAIGTNGADGSDLIRLATTGAPQGNGSTLTGEYKLFKRFYGLGHYSRFLDPGYVRIDATRVPVANTNVIAYKNPADNDFTINLTNSSTTVNNTLTLSLNNFPEDVEALTVYRTTADENMRKIGVIAANEDGTFTLEQPASSIITLVPTGKPKSELPGLDAERDLFSTLEAERDDSSVFVAMGTQLNDAGVVATGVQLNEAGTAAELKNGDVLVFRNINFQEGSANGGIVRRHMLWANPVGTQGAGGVLQARVDSPNGRIVAEFVIPKGTAAIAANWQLVDTGDLGAYGHRDLYLVAKGDDQAGILFTLDRFAFGDNGRASTAYTYEGNAVSNPGFQTNTTGWTGSGATLSRQSTQNYSDLAASGSTTTGYSMQLASRSAGGGAYVTLTAAQLVSGQRYRFLAEALSADENAADITAQLVYVNGSTVVATETLATKTAERLAARHGGGASGQPQPGKTAPYGPYDYAPYLWSPPGWNELTAEFVYSPPEGATGARLLITASGTANFFLDEVRVQVFTDKQGLVDAFATADLAVNPGYYTAASWAAYVAARAAANTTLLTAASTQPQLDAAAAALLAAYAALVDKRDLQQAIADADAFILAADSSLYVTETWTAFLDALDAAKLVDEKADATQAEVDDAKDALLAAQPSLKGTGAITLETPDKVTIKKGRTVKVEIDFNGNATYLAYTSGNPAVATVAGSGTLNLTVTGVKVGNAPITVRANDGSGLVKVFLAIVSA